MPGPDNRFFHSNVPMAGGNQLYLERPQIHQRLERAVQNPLVTVVAGAGYGKTQAVYSFVRRVNYRTAWIQFSERDNIGERFWENFTAAISVISRETAAQLAELGFPASEQQFDRYLRIPRNEVIPNEKYIFVYDDLHLVTDKTVLRFLEHSITTAFPNIVSILISRTEPPLNLMRMISKGLLVRITEEDLRFSREEMIAYFRLQQINPSPQAVSLIYHDTEGWAFAIHLAGLSLRNLPPRTDYVPQALRANIFKLIESEVMAPLKPELQRFLIKLSLVDHLAADLLRTLAGASPLMAEMEAIGSFIRFDTYLNAYRIHHLFLDYLRGRQQELSEAEKKKIWRQAALWCVENNQKLDAISYYEKAGAYEDIVKVVYEEFPLAMPNRIAQFVLEILDRAPEEVYRQIPAAWVLRSQALMILELFDRAVGEIKEIIATLEAETLTPFHYRVLSGCYNSLGFIGLTTCMYTRDYDYVHWFERGSRYHRLSGHKPSGPAAVASLSAYVCRVSVPDPGEIEKYIAANSGMVPYVTQSMSGLFAGLDDLARAEYAFFKADTAAAEPFAYQALYKAQQAHQYEIENRALYYLYRISIYNGTYEKIPGFLKLLEAQLSQKDYINRDTYYDIVMGWFHIQMGEPEKAAPWIKSDYEESELNALAQGLETLIQIKYHYHTQGYQAALAVMANQKGLYRYGGFLFGKTFFKLLEALCRCRLGEIPEAGRALEEAYALAAPNGLDMIFIEMGRDTQALIDTVGILADSGIPREWLEKIRRAAAVYAQRQDAAAAAFHAPAPRESREARAPGVSLSPREREVLLGLAQGLTRGEIAGLQGVPENAVKSALRRIYTKLGAANRADAVRIAAALKIISP